MRSAAALITRLEATGRTHPVVMAILLTETYFRDCLWRQMEYAAWVFLGLAWPSRARRLSIGISQIQLRHWVSLGLLPTVRWSPSSLARVLSAEANYDACVAFLQQADAVEKPFRAVAALYRGEARGYHVDTLKWFAQAITSRASNHSTNPGRHVPNVA